MATVEDTPTLKGPSLVIQGAIFAAMTVAALGIGWFAGSYLKRSEAPPSVPAAEANQGETAPAKNGDADPNAGPLLVRLAPITTNLASPTTIWVRLDASLVLDTPQPPDVVEAVHQDLLAYLRTLKMHQV